MRCYWHDMVTDRSGALDLSESYGWDKGEWEAVCREIAGTLRKKDRSGRCFALLSLKAAPDAFPFFTCSVTTTIDARGHFCGGAA